MSTTHHSLEHPPVAVDPQGGAVPQSGAEPAIRIISLKIKALILFIGVITYCVFISLFVLHQKTVLLDEFAELQGVYKVEDSLRRLNMAVFHVVMTIFSMNPQDREKSFSRLQENLQFIEDSHAVIGVDLSHYQPTFTGLTGALKDATASPSQANLADLRQKIGAARVMLDELADQVQRKQNTLAAEFRRRSNSSMMTALVLGMLGVVLIGAIIGLFFSRLTNDLHNLKTRATAIIRGYRGAPIPVTRNDEVGELMECINHMSSELDEREKLLAIERQKYVQQEKMAAVGGLAAGIAHEIGNPIAAIAGVAQAIREVQVSGKCPEPCGTCQPDLILAQTARLAAITREVSEFSSPMPAERQLLDLNALVRSTASLVRYDRRFRRIALELSLDSQLPAVSAVGDQLIQVLMNLLINAADATEGLEDRTPAISVSTSPAGDHARILVEDNGSGMDQDTLKHVFEPFFTTKPPGKGTGLGLAICGSIVEAHDGKIELESTPGVGTRVRILLPLNAAKQT